MKTIEIAFRGTKHAAEVDTLGESVRVFSLREIQPSGYLEDPKRKRDCDRARSGQTLLSGEEPRGEADSVTTLSGLSETERREVFERVREALGRG